MNIRKHWKKFALSLTAFFWASCHYEDTAQPLYGENCPSGSCIEPKIEGAESLYGVHSPSEGFDDPDLFSIIPASSNTKAAASSSSEVKVPNFSSAATPSSSSTEQSSSSQVSCMNDPTSFFYYDRSEQYTESKAISNATSKAKWDASRKISDIVIEQFKDKDVPKCLDTIQNSLESEFAPVYGAQWGYPMPKDFKCSDGTTIPTKEYLEQQEFDKEQAKKKPQYDEKYNEVYKKETEKLEEKINNCLESNQPISSSSEGTPKSSSSAEVTCAPGDSTVSYYPPSYSADIAKMSAGERAKRAGVAQIDSLKKTMQTTPQCLENLRQELDMLVALYGAPSIFHKDEVCSDGTTRATKEYQEYLKMKEEWEKNKPALDEECQKIYEEKLEAIRQKIDKCLKNS